MAETQNLVFIICPLAEFVARRRMNSWGVQCKQCKHHSPGSDRLESYPDQVSFWAGLFTWKIG